MVSEETLIKIFQAAPPVVIFGIILLLSLKWLFELAKKAINILSDLGNKYLATLNGYFTALQENNTLTRKAITDGADQNNKALIRISDVSELANTNIERMNLLLQTAAGTLEVQAKQADVNTKQVLDTVNERAEQLKKQSEAIGDKFKPLDDNLAHGFDQMRQLLTTIETKLDTNSTTLVSQIVAQFQPVFDTMTQANNQADSLTKQVVEVKDKIDQTSRQLESTFLTAIGQIVNNAATRPMVESNGGSKNGETDHGSSAA